MVFEVVEDFIQTFVNPLRLVLISGHVGALQYLFGLVELIYPNMCQEVNRLTNGWILCECIDPTFPNDGACLFNYSLPNHQT